jgi:hypothetical protein
MTPANPQPTMPSINHQRVEPPTLSRALESHPQQCFAQPSAFSPNTHLLADIQRTIDNPTHMDANVASKCPPTLSPKPPLSRQPVSATSSQPSPLSQSTSFSALEQVELPWLSSSRRRKPVPGRGRTRHQRTTAWVIWPCSFNLSQTTSTIDHQIYINCYPLLHCKHTYHTGDFVSCIHS